MTWWTWAVLIAIVVVFPGSLFLAVFSSRKLQPEIGELRAADGGGFEEYRHDGRWHLLPRHPLHPPGWPVPLCEHGVELSDRCWRCVKGIPARPTRHRDRGDRS